MTASRLAVVGAALVIVAVVAIRPPADDEPRPEGPAVVDRPASVQPAAPRHRPLALRPARAAIVWLLAAESGRARRPPLAHTFTPELQTELTARPPRPGRARARLDRLREIEPLGGVRRVLATVRRPGGRTRTTLLLTCTNRCLVASIE